MHPAVSIEHFGCRVFHLVVAGHDQKTAIPQFATLPKRYYLACRWISDLHLEMRQRPAHRPCSQFERIVQPRHAQTATAFRLSKNDADLRPDARMHLLHQSNGNRRAAALYLEERREIILCEVGMVQNGDEHGWDREGAMATVATDDLHGFDGVKSQQRVGRPTGVEGHENAGH